MAELNENDDLIELEDEDGNLLTYRLLQELEWNGVTYAVLEDTEDEEGFVSIFRVTEVVENVGQTKLVLLHLLQTKLPRISGSVACVPGRVTGDLILLCLGINQCGIIHEQIPRGLHVANSYQQGTLEPYGRG